MKKSFIPNLKLVMIGDVNTGKSAIFNRFRNNSFNNCYLSTIGIDLLNRKIDINIKGKNFPVNLQIFDTSVWCGCVVLLLRMFI